MKHAVSLPRRFYDENSRRSVMGTFWLLPVVLLLVTACIFGEVPPTALAPGIDITHYAFDLTLADTTDTIRGTATVDVRFTEDSLDALVLDLVGPSSAGSPTGMTVTSVMHDGHAVPFTHEDDRLRIQLTPPPETSDERAYTIAYQGIPADGLIIATNKFGDRTFFGDNWPNRARHWLPVVDHPSDKATVAWAVTAPEHYRVVANGLLVEETGLSGERRLTRWRSTAPLATKVMVIGAARFAIDEVAEYQGTSIQSWVYPQDRKDGFYDFALAEPILAFFVERLGPYPYGKLANVQSKTRYGGMENASAIFYNENAITGTRQIEPLLAHEIAHQWFGNAVTESGWPHLWLSEGFATYLAALYLEHAYGRARLEKDMRQDREQVLSYARQAPEALLIDSTTTDLMQLLNPNAYQKGAWVLHMLRHRVGDDVFWKGLRIYYEQFRHQNAQTRDFQQVMERVSGQDLSPFFQQWFTQPGQPHLRGRWRYDAGSGELTVTINQVQPHTLFDVLLELGIYVDSTDQPRIETVRVDERQESYTLSLPKRPSDVVLDPHVRLLMQADFGPS